MGRWGNVYSGDCFILTSDHLNAMVHIIEYANEVVTFQLRGLEFSGTYCQQREVEAINELDDSNNSCLCCRISTPDSLLSFNSAFNQRWLAWQVVMRNYVLDGYSISDNNAASLLGVFDLRKVLVTFIVKCTIFFLISHDSLESWMSNSSIRDQLKEREKSGYVDADSCFSVTIDDDFDVWAYGVTFTKFRSVYKDWVKYCCSKRSQKTKKIYSLNDQSNMMLISFALSTFARRALSTASSNTAPNLDSFLFGLHSLFKGDFRVTSSKDDWVFSDMNFMQDVVQPAVRTALKLHQDHFTFPEEFERDDCLYDSIQNNASEIVITHEGDPLWRKSVLSNASSLLALRRVVSEAFVDQYSVIKLKFRALGFSVVKVNRECVRGLWAGQQSELVFMRNRNPERGSIQNAKQVLRNMINSSCDQPIGYPIYVSPLTTSFASTCPQYVDVLGKTITFRSVSNFLNNILTCLRESCTGSCNSGGGYGNQHQHPITQHIPLATIAPASFRPVVRHSAGRSGELHTRSLPVQPVAGESVNTMNKSNDLLKRVNSCGGETRNTIPRLYPRSNRKDCLSFETDLNYRHRSSISTFPPDVLDNSLKKLDEEKKSLSNVDVSKDQFEERRESFTCEQSITSHL